MGLRSSFLQSFPCDPLNFYCEENRIVDESKKLIYSFVVGIVTEYYLETPGLSNSMYQRAILISPDAPSVRREFPFLNTMFDNEVAVSGGCIGQLALEPAYLPIQVHHDTTTWHSFPSGWCRWISQKQGSNLLSPSSSSSST